MEPLSLRGFNARHFLWRRLQDKRLCDSLAIVKSKLRVVVARQAAVLWSLLIFMAALLSNKTAGG